MTFLACRFLVKLAILPTLMLMFTLRWFVMNPLPKKTKKPNAGEKQPLPTRRATRSETAGRATRVRVAVRRVLVES